MTKKVLMGLGSLSLAITVAVFAGYGGSTTLGASPEVEISQPIALEVPGSEPLDENLGDLLGDPEQVELTDCSRTIPCETAGDCPCLPGECVCVNSQCGGICLCLRSCFEPDPGDL